MSDDFGLMVAKYREDKGWSQEDLSNESGISRNTIQRIENGSVPKIDKIEPLCSALDVSPNDLFGYGSGLDPSLASAIKMVARMSPEKQKKLAKLLSMQAELLL